MKSGTRTYSMDKRSGAAAETSRRILESTMELYWQMPIENVTLAMIAERSGVAVQTVIRKFGGRDEVFTAAAEMARDQVDAEREVAGGAALEEIVAVLVDHYEAYGDGVMKLLSEENSLPVIAEIIAHGRELHRDWCDRVFAAELDSVAGPERRRRRAQLIAICDVYTWKLLRRDNGLSRKETELAIAEMVAALTGEQS